MGRWVSEYISGKAVQNVQNVQKVAGGGADEVGHENEKGLLDVLDVLDGLPRDTNREGESDPVLASEAPVRPLQPPETDAETLAEAYLRLRRGPPEGVDDARWRAALTDGDAFMETWGDQAEALGWTAADLFGLHPKAPLSRYEAMGLFWLLRGRPVMFLTRTEAIIRTPTGATLTFRRMARP
jgi:hypothetical protein